MEQREAVLRSSCWYTDKLVLFLFHSKKKQFCSFVSKKSQAQDIFGYMVLKECKPRAAAPMLMGFVRVHNTFFTSNTIFTKPLELTNRFCM